MKVTIEPMVDNVTSASAAEFNNRFSKLASTVNNLDDDNFKANSITEASLAQSVFEKMYPIGTIYENGSDNTNPSVLLGLGVWEYFGDGRVLVGFDSTDTDFDAVGDEGGQKDVMAHTHDVRGASNGDFIGLVGGGQGGWGIAAGQNNNIYHSTAASTGSGTNNMNPYKVVYRWIRTA